MFGMDVMEEKQLDILFGGESVTYHLQITICHTLVHHFGFEGDLQLGNPYFPKFICEYVMLLTFQLCHLNLPRAGDNVIMQFA